MTPSRTSFVDQLRGMALVGIILVNAPFLALGLNISVYTQPMLWWDAAAVWFVNAFAEGKLYLIFSFLFGYSALRFMKIDSDEGRLRFKRRIWALGVIGVLHAWLFFIGDILFGYAILGVGLLAMTRKPPEKRRKVAIVLIAITFVVLCGLAVLGKLFPSSPSPDPWVLTFNAAMSSNSFFDSVMARMAVWPLVQVVLSFLNYGYGFAMMLLGTIAAEQGLFESPDPRARIWQFGRHFGFGIGLPIAVLCGAVQDDWATPLMFAFAPLLTWGYISALIALHANGARWLSAFESAGQMSMTCYVLESVILATLCCGWGFGLYGKLGFAASTGTAVLTCVLIEVFAKLYLSRVAQGPLETLVSRWTKKDAIVKSRPV